MTKKPVIFSIFGVIALAIVILVIKPAKLPASVILPVPFTTQAPTDNWSRNEDCEEASMAMSTAFLNGQSGDQMSAADAEKAINELKGWENANIGYNTNTGAEATQKMAEGAFKLKVKQIPNFSEQDLKKALAGNHPILLPINARLLNNPKYLNNGPLYHMIVIRGYDAREFIVNDPGTETGDGNVYTFAILKNAAADWDQTNKVMNPNRKIALVLSK